MIPAVRTGRPKSLTLISGENLKIWDGEVLVFHVEHSAEGVVDAFFEDPRFQDQEYLLLVNDINPINLYLDIKSDADVEFHVFREDWTYDGGAFHHNPSPKGIFGLMFAEQAILFSKRNAELGKLIQENAATELKVSVS